MACWYGNQLVAEERYFVSAVPLDLSEKFDVLCHYTHESELSEASWQRTNLLACAFILVMEMTVLIWGKLYCWIKQ